MSCDMVVLTYCCKNWNYGTTMKTIVPQQGHIAYYLKQTPRNYLNGLAGLPGSEIAASLANQKTPYRENLDLLLVQPNLDGQQPVLSGMQTAVGRAEAQRRTQFMESYLAQLREEIGG